MKIIANIISVQIGEVTTTGDVNSTNIINKQYTTASYKEAVLSSVNVTKLNIVGDNVADTIHHGGVDKAIFVNSLKNYLHWKTFLKKDTLPFGALGENLTVDNIDEHSVCIGDIHQIGTVKVQVSQPRQPCWKISRRWENKEFFNEIYNSGKTGWYYRVLEEGSFKAGDSIIYISSINNKITINDANEAMRNQDLFQDRVQELLKIEELAQAWKNSLKAYQDKI